MLRDICIIDNRPHDYTDLLAKIERKSVVFHFAATAEDALRICVGRDAIWLVNIHLSDTSGLELYGQLRDRGMERVFVVNDRQEMTDELLARSSGVPFYGVKPPQTEWVAAH